MELLIVLIFVVTNIGTLLLFRRMATTLQTVLVEVDGFKRRQRLEHLLTRRRIAQVKTRLADEERQNQKDLARARYERRKEAGETDSAK